MAVVGCGSGTATPSVSPSASATDCAPGASCQTGPNGLPVGFVRLADVDPSILQEMRYTTAHNFVGTPIAGYDAADCWVTAQTADALKGIQQQARAKGYTLKVYDCYRPQRAVNNFMVWAADPAATSMKAEFYPRVAKDRIIPDGYVATKSGHSRGSTIDLTLVPLPGATSAPWSPSQPLLDCALPADQRFPDTSIDMGTGFDCFDVRAHPDYTALTPVQRKNRDLLLGMMSAAGFKVLPEEWWHYTLINEPFPDTYFDVPISPVLVSASPTSPTR